MVERQLPAPASAGLGPTRTNKSSDVLLASVGDARLWWSCKDLAGSSNDGIRSASYGAEVDIRGAKTLRDRIEELHGVAPDAEPAREISEHGLPLYAWTGTTPDPGRPASKVEENQGRRRFRKRH
jgi:hypothetical protein